MFSTEQSDPCPSDHRVQRQQGFGNTDNLAGMIFESTFPPPV